MGTVSDCLHYWFDNMHTFYIEYGVFSNMYL